MQQERDSSATTTSASETTTKSQGHAGARLFRAGREGCDSRSAAAEGDANTQAVEALLAGPNDFEKSPDRSTVIPPGTKLQGVTVANETATVDLSSDFQSGAGGLSMQVRVAEVVFTLRQFGDVKRVTITLDGKPVEAIGSEGIPAKGLGPCPLQ